MSQTTLQEKTESDLSELSSWSLADNVIVVGIMLFSVFYCIALLTLLPFDQIQGGDAANIAGFAAGWDYPENFYGDGLLSNPDNFRFYATVHIPVLQFLAPLTGGYGSAFSSLLGLHVFLQSFGFYILGKLLFQNKYWAVLLVVLNLMPVWFNLGEFWGAYPNAIPRFSFQALLPFLLAAVYYWRLTPKAWPWVMAFAGLLVYAHPVSAPGWAFAVWLSLWLFLPKAYTLPRKVAYMGFIGLICTAVVLPFLIHYLANHEHGAVENQRQVYEIMKGRFLEGYLELPTAVKQFFLILHKKYLLVLSVIGSSITLVLHRSRRDVLLVLLWIVGLLIFNVCLPILGHTIAEMRGEIPAQIDLIRGIRYLVPLMLLFCIWPLVELSHRFKAYHFKISAIGAILVSIWVYWHPIGFFPKAVGCWQQGDFQCFTDRIHGTAELLDALPGGVPPASPIFVAPSAMDTSLAIRYHSLLPVVYSSKDGGALAYANHAELLNWNQIRGKMDLINQESDPENELRMLSELSCDTDAQYLLTSKVFTEANQTVPRPFPNSSYFSQLNLQEIYSNDIFSLLKIEGYCSNRK